MRPAVFVDDVPRVEGLDALERMPSSEIYLIEVISGGKSTVHVVPPSAPSPADADALDDGESIPETSLTSPKKDATLRDQ